jgi:hypothetical protein
MLKKSSSANQFFSNASGNQLANVGSGKQVWGVDAVTGAVTDTPAPAVATTTTVLPVKNMTNTGYVLIGVAIGALGAYLWVKKSK